MSLRFKYYPEEYMMPCGRIIKKKILETYTVTEI